MFIGEIFSKVEMSLESDYAGKLVDSKNSPDAVAYESGDKHGRHWWVRARSGLTTYYEERSVVGLNVLSFDRMQPNIIIWWNVPVLDICS